MNITIIGNGQVGQALGQALGRSGHGVVFGVRTPAPEDSRTRAIEVAVAEADAVILAVPFSAIPDVLAAAGNLSGKIVIDASNPLGMNESGLGLTLGHSTSGAEVVAARAPGAHVFKTFNQTGFENLADARGYAARPLMLLAGDDADAKEVVRTLVSDAGFDAVDLGGLHQARPIEPFAMVWIELGRKRGFGPNFSFSLQFKGTLS